ncbi:MAG: DUF6314 family protein [Pseudomonadota bacterium]
MDEATERYFRGHWAMRRIIENVAEGVIGEFWGEARFDAVPPPAEEGMLACREEGVLRFRGHDYHAERGSLWRFPGPGEVEVQYTDGRPFHAFPTKDPVAEHLCGEDLYRVRYDFGPSAWMSVWEVQGPDKDYQMMTEYRRMKEKGENPFGGSVPVAAGMHGRGEAMIGGSLLRRPRR